MRRCFKKTGYNEGKGDSKISVRKDGPHGVLGQRGNRGKHASGEFTGKMGASYTKSTDGLEVGPLENPVRRWKPEVQGLREGLITGLLRGRERLKAEIELTPSEER